MELVEAKCPNCGAKLNIPLDAKTVKCEYCGSEFALDRKDFKDAEELGYEFEKGRIKAYQEAVDPPKKHYFLKALGWIFVFPVMITYYTVKGERMSKLPKWAKIAINAAAYIVYIMIMMTSE